MSTKGVMSQRCLAKRARVPVFACADVHVLSAERKRERGGEDCSIPHCIDFPAQRGDVGNVSL